RRRWFRRSWMLALPCIALARVSPRCSSFCLATTSGEPEGTGTGAAPAWPSRRRHAGTWRACSLCASSSSRVRCSASSGVGLRSRLALAPLLLRADPLEAERLPPVATALPWPADVPAAPALPEPDFLLVATFLLAALLEAVLVTVFFAVAFFAVAFFAVAFFAVAFFAVAFFAVAFFAVAFFAVAFFAVAFLAPVCFAAGFFATAFLAAGLFATFFAAVFRAGDLRAAEAAVFAGAAAFFAAPLAAAFAEAVFFVTALLAVVFFVAAGLRLRPGSSLAADAERLADFFVAPRRESLVPAAAVDLRAARVAMEASVAG